MSNDGCLLDREECFQIYFGMGSNRSFERLIKQLEESHPGFVPALQTIKEWSIKGEWQKRIALMDVEIQEGVREQILPEWIEIKAYLLKTLLEQVKKARTADITPENSRELVSVVHEIRSIMGEGDTTDINITGIEYVPFKQEKENEN